MSVIKEVTFDVLNSMKDVPFGSSAQKIMDAMAETSKETAKKVLAVNEVLSQYNNSGEKKVRPISRPEAFELLIALGISAETVNRLLNIKPTV